MRAMLIGTVVALLLTGCGSGGSSEPPESTASKFSSSSPEYQLASIDDHGGKPTDAQVEHFVSVLDRLQGTCTDTKRQLADWASGIKSEIAPHDSEAHLFALALEQVRRLEAQGARRSSCHDVFLVIGIAAKGGA